jgi:hypothetical protein
MDFKILFQGGKYQMKIATNIFNNGTINTTTKSVNTNRTQSKNSNTTDTGYNITISRKGKDLSKQQTTQSVQTTRKEQMLLNQQEKEEQAKKVQNSYRDKLTEINKQLKDLNNSYSRKQDLTMTEKEKWDIIDEMQEQKEFQEEESQRLTKEAQKMALQYSKCDEKVDENKRDLVALLKIIEESHKDDDEENRTGKSDSSSDDESLQGETKSVGDSIQNVANEYAAQSMRGELGMTDKLTNLADNGKELINKASSMIKSTYDEIENISKALDDDSFTEEEKANMITKFQEEFAPSYKDMKDYRAWGLQNLQDARDLKIQHISDNSLNNMEETQENLMQLANASTLGQARYETLDKTSQDLDNEIDKLIDKQKDIDTTKEDEEDKEIEENKEDEEEKESLASDEDVMSISKRLMAQNKEAYEVQ